MPIQETISQRYWGWCRGWWGVKYPCRKTRTRIKWCYQFQTLKEVGYGVASKLTGCEDGVQYQWWAGSFNVWGTTHFSNIKQCFSSQRNRSGSC